MRHNNHNSRGFTLIELLVVISIIGLLSSVILAALSGARAKGIIAADQTFDGNNHAAYYGICSTCTTADWDFDEGSTGGVVADQSGNNNSLTLNDGASLISSPNPFPTGQVLYINTDPSNGGNSSESATVSTLNAVPTGDFSVSFWLQPMALPAGAYNFISNNNIGSAGSWKFGANNYNSLQFVVGSWITLVPVTYPTTNQWFQIVLVCNSSRVGIYVNAKFAVFSGNGNNSCAFSNSGNTLTIGGSAGDPSFYMDNIRIYKQALPISAIQSIYMAESKEPRHLAEVTK